MALAIAPGICLAQGDGPASAAADPLLGPLCAQVLRAAERRDFALLLPVLNDPVKIGPHEEWISHRRLPELIQVWPEDFGLTFWRDLRDVVQSGVRERASEQTWRRAGIVVAFRPTKGEWKITAFLRPKEPRTHLLPVDVAASQPGLAEVRTRIRSAVARRDMGLLLPVLGPYFSVEDDAYTPPDFVARYKDCRDACDEFWRRVHDAISVGMAWYGIVTTGSVPDRPEDDVWAPYPFVKLMATDDLAITAEGVALRSAPDEKAATIELLHYHVVKEIPGSNRTNYSHPVRIDGFTYGWRRVRSPSGKTGWVVEKYVWGTGDYALRFSRINGIWKLVAIKATHRP
jgi:hypothetical protein